MCFLAFLLLCGSSNSWRIPEWPEIEQVMARENACVPNILNVGTQLDVEFPSYTPTHKMKYKIHELYTYIRIREIRMLVKIEKHMHYFRLAWEKPPSARVDKLSVKYQIVNSSGFENHIISVNYSPLPLQHESSHR